ncbi:MAG: glycosyltransferase [Clostridia bacterium]|nr:glycosyltransferase [Clostridia bacterium]
MRITVLLSTYNGERYLREQLDSILEQKLPDNVELKILARDDGSKDKTLDILEEYVQKYGNVVSYYTGENLKPEKSFWHLVCNCEQSDYYAYADQDDVWFPDKLARGIAAIQQVENADMPIIYNSNVMVTDAELNPVAPMNNEKVYTDLAHVLIYNVSTGCTDIFNDAARREFVQYDMDRNMVIMHDRLSDLITVLFGKIIYDTVPGMYYRQHGDNVCGEQSIGKVKSFFKRVKRFFGSSNSIRSERSKMLLNLYGDRLDDEQKRLLYAVGYYRTDKKARKTLLKDKAFSKNKKADFWFRWAVRLKLI